MDEMKKEFVRVSEKIEQLIKDFADQKFIEEDISFNKEIYLKLKDLYIKGIVYSFNTMICSSEFKNATRKRRINCLANYKKAFEEYSKK